MREREENHGETAEHVKRAKLRSFEPVDGADEGINTQSLQITKQKKIESLAHQNEEEGTSKVTDATTLTIFDKLAQMPMDHNLLISDSTIPKHLKEKNSCKTDLVALDVDLNDPFYPYKKLGQVGPTDASECGSTTGSVEISESMKRWIEMKRNGFVSTSQEKASIPKARKRQHTKRNNVELKKKIDTIKKDQSNMHTKIASPNQLLSGLNPGIIKHVRNSKQVNSIIKAMLQNESLQKQEARKSIGEFERGNEEVINGWKGYGHGSEIGHLGLSFSKPLSPCSSKKDIDMFKDNKFNHETCKISKFKSECDDDALVLKLSSSVTMEPEQARKTTNADFSINPEDITSLSSKAASVALLWLGLIQSDIKSRISKLKSSKNRVKNAILKELPCIFSRDLYPQQGNERFMKETLDKHLVLWKALFSQMEESLTQEENQLEKWFRQVEELRSQCQEGLKYVCANGFSHLESIKDLRILQGQEACEWERVVRAAAASIYSTCEMIMTT